MTKRNRKNVNETLIIPGFLTSKTFLGIVVCLITGFIVGIVNVPLYIYALCPFIAGVITSSGKSGMKAGALTFLIPIISTILLARSIPNFDFTAPEPVIIKASGPIGSVLAALTTGIVRSTQGVAYGLRALVTGIGQTIALIVLIMIPVLLVIGTSVSAIIGRIGGIIGR